MLACNLYAYGQVSTQQSEFGLIFTDPDYCYRRWLSSWAAVMCSIVFRQIRTNHTYKVSSWFAADWRIPANDGFYWPKLYRDLRLSKNQWALRSAEYKLLVFDGVRIWPSLMTTISRLLLELSFARYPLRKLAFLHEILSAILSAIQDMNTEKLFKERILLAWSWVQGLTDNRLELDPVIVMVIAFEKVFSRVAVVEALAERKSWWPWTMLEQRLLPSELEFRDIQEPGKESRNKRA